MLKRNEFLSQQYLADQASSNARKTAENFFRRAMAHTRYRGLRAERHDAIDELDLSKKAKARLKRDATLLLKDDPDLEPEPISMVIPSLPGVGKTRAMGEAFEAIEPGAADVYMPTVEMCEQFTDHDRRPSAIRELARAADYGRSLHYPDELLSDEDRTYIADRRKKDIPHVNCPRAYKADILSKSHAAVTPTLCRGCNLRPHCGYFKQEERLQEAYDTGRMIIRTHARLWSGSLIDDAPIKVIDESILKACLKGAELPLIDLTEHRITAIVGTPIGALDGAYEVSKFVQAFCRAPTVKVSSVIQSPGSVRRLMSAITDRCEAIEQTLHAHRRTSAELSTFLQAQGLKFLNELKILCQQLLAAFNAEASLATARADDTSLKFLYARKINVKAHQSLLILDASYREDFLKILFPKRDFEVERSSVDELSHNVEIGLVDITATNQQLLGGKDASEAERRSAEIKRRAIIQAAQKFIDGDALVTANKKIAAQIEKDGVPDGWEVANFGALRGKNKWEKMAGVVVIGQALPTVDMIERQAAVFGLMRGEAVVTYAEWSAKNGRQTHVKSLLPMDEEQGYFHPCPLVWKFIEAEVHDEYIQAIGRCRAVRSERPKRVYMATKLFPEELREFVVGEGPATTFDQLTIYEKAVIKDVLTEGWSLLGPTWLAEKHDVSVRSIKDAKRRIERGIDETVSKVLGGMLGDLGDVAKSLKIRHVKGTGSLFNINIGSPYPFPKRVESIDNQLLVIPIPVTYGRTKQQAVILARADLTEHDWERIKFTVPKLTVLTDIVEAKDAPEPFGITFLRCVDEGTKATKTFRPDPATGRPAVSESYKSGTFFDPSETLTVESVEDLARIMNEKGYQADRFAIRGRIREGKPFVQVRRTFHFRNDRQPFFEDTPKAWIMVDVDKWQPGAPPVGLEWSDMTEETLARMVVAGLPEPLCDVSCYVRASASCLVKRPLTGSPGAVPSFSAHLWFMLDKPLTSQQAKSWLAGMGERVGKTTMYRLGDCVVDMSVYSPVQPHYTADPIFEECQSPMKQRGWLIAGAKAVVEVDAEEITRVTKAHVQRYLTSERPVSDVEFQIALSNIGEGLAGFQEGVKRAARPAAGLIRQGLMNESKAVRQIAAAVYAANPGNRSSMEIDRYASEEFIVDKIEWWQQVRQQGIDDHL